MDEFIEKLDPVTPDYEPTQEEIEEYATWLGANLETDRSLLWIARDALKSPIPEGWKLYERKDRASEPFYFNTKTGESLWDHPHDEYFRELFRKEKKKLLLTEKPTSILKNSGIGNKTVPFSPTIDDEFENFKEKQQMIYDRMKEEIRDSYKKQLENENAIMINEIVGIKEEHKKKMDLFRHQIESMEEEHKYKISSISENHYKDVEQIRINHEKEKNDLEHQLTKEKEEIKLLIMENEAKMDVERTLLYQLNTNISNHEQNLKKICIKNENEINLIKSQHMDSIRDIENQNELEINRIRKEHEHSLRNMKRDHEKTVQKYIEDQKDILENERKSIIELYRNPELIASLKNKFNEKVALIKQEHENEINELKQDNEKEIESFISNHERKLNKLKKQNERVINEEKKKKDRIIKQNVEEIESMKRHHHDLITETKYKCEKEERKLYIQNNQYRSHQDVVMMKEPPSDLSHKKLILSFTNNFYVFSMHPKEIPQFSIRNQYIFSNNSFDDFPTFNKVVIPNNSQLAKINFNITESTDKLSSEINKRLKDLNSIKESGVSLIKTEQHSVVTLLETQTEEIAHISMSFQKIIRDMELENNGMRAMKPKYYPMKVGF